MSGPLDIVEVAKHKYAIQVFLCSAYLENQLRIDVTDLNCFITDNDNVPIYGLELGLT